MPDRDRVTRTQPRVGAGHRARRGPRRQPLVLLRTRSSRSGASPSELRKNTGSSLAAAWPRRPGILTPHHWSVSTLTFFPWRVAKRHIEAAVPAGTPRGTETACAPGLSVASTPRPQAASSTRRRISASRINPGGLPRYERRRAASKIWRAVSAASRARRGVRAPSSTSAFSPRCVCDVDEKRLG